MMNDNTLFGITIDRHISIGHIATTIAALFAGIYAYANMVNRIYNLEQADSRIESQIEVMHTDYQRTVDKIDYKLENIINKLDKKVDK